MRDFLAWLVDLIKIAAFIILGGALLYVLACLLGDKRCNWLWG
jgi:hypothetical protein